MDPLTIAILLGAAAVVGVSAEAPKSPSLPPNQDPDSPWMKDMRAQVLERLRDASKITVPPESQWVEIALGDRKYLVAPSYIAPIGIGEAKRLAAQRGWVLPSRALVDAIWQAADLKLRPLPRGPGDKPPSDFTAKTMNSPETNIAQLARISDQIQKANPNYRLLAGTHKDIVEDVIPPGYANASALHEGIYGWQDPTTGKPIQGFMWGHASGEGANDWKDYSQGLRGVRVIA